ncbi:MAG TPA: hypothetical protein VIY72_08430 [Acidimicrobiales bacterium]
MRGAMVVQSGPREGREDDFNDWYSNVHVPEVLSVDGFVGARRFRALDGDHYLTVYELEADDITVPVAEFRDRSAAGETTRSDSLRTDPPPVVTLYELVEDLG